VVCTSMRGETNAKSCPHQFRRLQREVEAWGEEW